MGKSTLGKHFGYYDQLMSKLNKILIENLGEITITVNRGLLEEIIATHKRIKDEKDNAIKKFVEELRKPSDII